MGVVLKIFAFLLGLSMLGFGAGVFAIPLFLYALWGVIFRGRRASRSEAQPEESSNGRKSVRKRMILGMALLAISTIALTQGGRFSVAFFGGLGVILLFWGRLPRAMPFSATRPVEDSVLLRSALLPMVWISVSEIKLLTRNFAGTLSSVDGPMIMTTSGKPSVSVVNLAIALTHSQAMDKVTERIRDLASVLRPLGGYLVPLDSHDASMILRTTAKATRFKREDWKRAIQTSPYDYIALDPKRGFVESIGLYRRVEGKLSRPSAVRARVRLSKPPLLWEVVKAIEARVTWPEPDEVAGYVAALGATQGRPLAQRIVDGKTGEETITTQVLGSRPVELKATQLRALVKVYE